MIGNFSVGKTKGKGTFGKVKQGTHEPTGEKVSFLELIVPLALIFFCLGCHQDLRKRENQRPR